MPKGRLGAEQIVTKLRQMEVLQAQGKSVSAACKELGRPSRPIIAGAESMADSMLRRASA
jgi:hypothetical protein